MLLFLVVNPSRTLFRLVADSCKVACNAVPDALGKKRRHGVSDLPGLGVEVTGEHEFEREGLKARSFSNADGSVLDRMSKAPV